MAFANGLSSLISHGDEMNTLIRTLVQSLRDHGGSERHLNDLLRDAKGNRALIDELAKRIVGPIWNLADAATDLGTIDFKMPALEFARSLGYPIRESRSDIEYLWDFSQTEPRASCRYMLAHSQMQLRFDELPDDILLGTNREHASWRELLVYVSRLTSKDLCRCVIMAAGSRAYENDDPRFSYPRFPVARHGDECDSRVDVYGERKIPGTLLDRDIFYLVRVYEK